LVCLQFPVVCSLLAIKGCSLVPSTCSTWVCGAVRRLPLRQYALLCSAQYIPRIRTPTLLLAATDDLFVWCIPACISEAGLGQAPAVHDPQYCVSCTLPPGMRVLGRRCCAERLQPMASPLQCILQSISECALGLGWQCAACLHYMRNLPPRYACVRLCWESKRVAQWSAECVCTGACQARAVCSMQDLQGVAELWAPCACSGLPTAECRGNPATVLATTRRGGHCAHLQGLKLTGPTYMEDAAVKFFRAVLRADPAKLHPGLALGDAPAPERRHKRVARRPA